MYKILDLSVFQGIFPSIYFFQNLKNPTEEEEKRV